MKIEVLFPELCNLNGDISNIKYLQKCMPEAEIIETAIEEKPAFVENDDINWDLALEYIYQNSLENTSEEIVPLSKEEIKQHLEFIEEAYDEIKAKFKDYDTAELACNLENYSFFESEKDNGNVDAATYLNNITCISI